MFVENLTRVANGFNSYAKLGLTMNLNPLAHGGFERLTHTSVQESSPLSSVIDSADHEPCIPSGFGRILRDDAGNIIGFEASKNEEERTGSEVAEVECLWPNQAVHQRWAATPIDPQGKGVLKG